MPSERCIRRSTTILALGILLLSAGGVLANQDGVSDCKRTINKESPKLIAALQKIMLKCYARKHKCLAEPPAERQACRDDADAHKDCSCETLGIDFVNGSGKPSKAKKAADKTKVKLAKTCDPASGADVTLDEILATDPMDPSVGLRFNKNRRAKCGGIVGDEDGEIENIAEIFDCVVTLAAMQAAMQVGWDVDPAARGELADLAAAGQCNVVGVPPGLIAAPCTFNVTLKTVPVGAEGAVGQLNVPGLFKWILDLGAPNGVRIVQLRAVGPFERVILPFPGHGVTMCAEFGCDVEGRLCCHPDGCPDLGEKSFDVNRDHDASGLNAGFGPHEMRPADAACRKTAVNAISTLPPFVTSPCVEDPARPSACNRAGLGEASVKSHAPRCSGGALAGRLCDPALALVDCPGSIGGDVCASRSTVPAASLAAAPCNGPMTVVPPGVPEGFDDGDMVLQSSVQLTVHPHALNVVTYVGECLGGDNDGDLCDEDSPDCDDGGTCSCNNKAGGLAPDGFGCDGLPCTDDDTTPKHDAVKVTFTTGTTGTTIFDRDMGSALNLATGAQTGDVPDDACANLINGDATDYLLNGTLPILDDPTLGDFTMAIELDW